MSVSLALDIFQTLNNKGSMVIHGGKSEAQGGSSNVEVVVPDEIEHIESKAKRRGYYTVPEWSELQGVNEDTVRRHIEGGKIPQAHKGEDGRWVIPVGEWQDE